MWRLKLAVLVALLTLSVPAHASSYTHWGVNAGVFVVMLAVVIATIMLHYLGLTYAWRQLNRRPGSYRHRRVLYGILFALALHIAEIWLFGLTYWLLDLWPVTGKIGMDADLSLLDAVYFSATTYSTAGYGDLVPVGPVRLIAGTEALVGFLLITWSASFSYLEMDRNWRGKGG